MRRILAWRFSNTLAAKTPDMDCIRLLKCLTVVDEYTP